MLTIYGSYLPLRIMEEIRLCKLKERENAECLRLLAPGLPAPYVTLLQEWEQVFTRNEQQMDTYIDQAIDHARAPELHTVSPLVAAALRESREFVSHLVKLSEPDQVFGSSVQTRTIVQHMIRHSDYYTGIFSALYDNLQAQASPIEETRSPLPLSQLFADRPDAPVPIGGHTLPPLPYDYDALEPYIDAETMRIHHDILHNNYVLGLNKAELALEAARQEQDYDQIKRWSRELAFNGGGHYLHTLFWNVMSPHGGGEPGEALLTQIQQDFGSYEQFKQQFSAAAQQVEGGGWAVLVWSPRSHRLQILQAEKHQNLSQWDAIPILALDVWEHAYYLNYKNERAPYIDAWWQIIYWPYAEARFREARKVKWAPY